MKDDTPGGGAPDGPQVDGETAWTVLSYLITGPLTIGGLGWLLDRWLGTTWIVGVGLVVGMALSLYIVVLRYVVGTDRRNPPGDAHSDQGG